MLLAACSSPAVLSDLLHVLSLRDTGLLLVVDVLASGTDRLVLAQLSTTKQLTVSKQSDSLKNKLIMALRWATYNLLQRPNDKTVTSELSQTRGSHGILFLHVSRSIKLSGRMFLLFYFYMCQGDQ